MAPRILELAQEVPYNVQRLAHETWEMARARGRTELEAGLVDEARGERRYRLVDPFFAD